MYRAISKVLFFFLSFLLIFSPLLSNLEAAKKTILVKINRDVRLIRAKKESKPKVGMDLLVKDEVLTGRDSTADVRFPTEEVIRIMENSKLRINEGKPNEVTLGLSRGKIFNVVYKYVDKVTSYKVITPTAAVGVRGTVFSAEVDAEGTTVIMVKEGKLAVSNPAVSPEEVIVGDLQKTIVRKGKFPTLPVALTAAEIALFAIIADLLPVGAGVAATAGKGISTKTALAIVALGAGAYVVSEVIKEEKTVEIDVTANREGGPSSVPQDYTIDATPAISGKSVKSVSVILQYGVDCGTARFQIIYQENVIADTGGYVGDPGSSIEGTLSGSAPGSSPRVSIRVLTGRGYPLWNWFATVRFTAK